MKVGTDAVLVVLSWRREEMVLRWHEVWWSSWLMQNNHKLNIITTDNRNNHASYIIHKLKQMKLKHAIRPGNGSDITTAPAACTGHTDNDPDHYNNQVRLRLNDAALHVHISELQDTQVLLATWHGEHAPPNPSLDLRTQEGWKAELT